MFNPNSEEYTCTEPSASIPPNQQIKPIVEGAKVEIMSAQELAESIFIELPQPVWKDWELVPNPGE